MVMYDIYSYVYYVVATVTFIVRSIHPVRVVGNLAVLGQWSLQNSKKLRNDPVGSEQWVGYIKLDAELQQTIEFQFITVSNKIREKHCLIACRK